MAMPDPVNAPMTRTSERTTPLRAAAGDRIGAGVIAGLCLTVLALGAWLSPDPAGHGTHEKLGLAPCTWAVVLDRPCPTCGMTTSFSHAGEGNWAASVMTQPFAAALVILTATVFWAALAQAATGARIGATIQPALRPRVFLIVGALLLAAWVYKMMTWTVAL